MAISTKVNGKMIRPKAKVNSGNLMATSMKASGEMIKLGDKVSTLQRMAANTSVIGRMIYNMVKELRPGQTNHSTMAHIRMEQSTVEGSIDMLMAPYMRASLGRIFTTAWAQ
jgi:hypothetical protein